MSQTNEVADVLRKALDVLRERGLAKGHVGDRAGHVCSLAAVSSVADDARFGSVCAVLHEIVIEQWPERSRPSDGCPADVVHFNDHPDTTQDDVERAFEKAIARAEEMI